MVQREIEYRMKGRKKLYLYVLISAAAVYIVLLLALYCAESVNDGAPIHTLGDAVWYSLVTMTTVGYGDLVPVTPLGHAVGIVSLFLASGIMVTMLGAVISFITGELITYKITYVSDLLGFLQRAE